MRAPAGGETRGPRSAADAAASGWACEDLFLPGALTRLDSSVDRGDTRGLFEDETGGRIPGGDVGFSTGIALEVDADDAWTFFPRQ